MGKKIFAKQKIHLECIALTKNVRDREVEIKSSSDFEINRCFGRRVIRRERERLTTAKQQQILINSQQIYDENEHLRNVYCS